MTLTYTEKFNNLMDSLAEDVVNMSDEEIREELIAMGKDPEKVADDVRKIIDAAIKKSKAL